MFYLIGLGLRDVKDISFKGLEIVKKADEVYAEFYTSISSAESDIKEFFGREINIIEREKLEQNFGEMITKAKDKNIVLLVPGDPLAATTHVQFLIEAKEKGVDFEIIHSSSIFSAIAEIGLQLYKFGYTVSIPFDEKVVSYVDKIKTNQNNGLHTLCLLDLNPKDNAFLTVNEALSRMLSNKVIEQDTKVVVINNLGSTNKVIKYDFVKNLLNVKLGEGVSSIVIPGKLHFVEEEALEKLCG